MRCPLFLEDEIAVNFVRYKNEIMMVAELGQLQDLLSLEDATQGVLGVAEKEKPCVGGNRMVHGFPVEGPP